MQRLVFGWSRLSLKKQRWHYENFIMVLILTKIANNPTQKMKAV
jgi:hypothetical protein